ncbi:orotidine-5'-phosphate decarboxylase [Streptomyces chartreusis]|uniref:orotidine-5'-phosphate decarboxylase n=1 Tax=Streptomyces chartreusis TaxID=1969 RepID=UPI00339F9208
MTRIDLPRTDVGPCESFGERWTKLAAERSALCLGVAPSSSWLARWDLTDDVRGAAAYCDRILRAATGVAAVKVQVPFFARFGPEGLDLLARFTERCHEHGSLVVMDAKVGDADDTMHAYADLYLGPGSRLGGDAVTANAYMGLRSIHPLAVRAGQVGAAVLVLVRTSNHAAEEVQQASSTDDRTVAQRLADDVAAWNHAQAPDASWGPFGAVVGARLPESADLVARLPRCVVEVPGLGRPDRATAEVLAAVPDGRGDALLTITSGVLRHGPDVGALRTALEAWRERIRP